MTQITTCGDVEQRAIDQLTRCAEKGHAPLAAICADGHVGYSMPIGGVVGYRDYVSPSGVGYDIGCGNMAVCTNVTASDIYGDLSTIMDMIAERIDFGMGVRPGNKADHPVLEQIANADFVPQRGLLRLARDQLGTVGSGNHYVDIFRDEKERVWVGVHFGSRGFGHKTATGFLVMSAEQDRRAKWLRSRPGVVPLYPPLTSCFAHKTSGEEMDALPTLLSIHKELGQSYIAAMELAGAYAYAGREVVMERVLDILGASVVDSVHNNHNFSWLESHWVDGKKESLWVVRKGATPAFPRQRGFVGATMGEPAVILEGSPSMPETSTAALQQGLLYSTVHGAGRIMSRSDAAGKKRWRWMCSSNRCDWVQAAGTHKPEDGKCPKCHDTHGLLKRPIIVSGGKIDWGAALDDLKRKSIELRGAAADEAPLAYKRLDQVLAYQKETVKILHTLTPMGVAMAGTEVRDDYKD